MFCRSPWSPLPETSEALRSVRCHFAAWWLRLSLAGALVLNRLIASLLFGVQPTDPVTIASVIATITAVAVVASWLPAWRASRVEPNIVLRDE